MGRWLVFAACAMALGAAGCSASVVQAGLANAPRHGGTGLADERVHDVIANGDDSCDRWAEHGPLRHRVPPCPAMAHPVASTWLLPSAAGGSSSLVLPWLQHFYAGWACPEPAFSTDRTLAWAAALAPAAPSPVACGLR
jgi:hypothetical protein